MKAAKPIFFILLLLFIVLNVYFILTIQGLMIDFANLKIIKTGGVYIMTVPAKTEIFLNNNKYYQPLFSFAPKIIKPPFFQEGRLIKNLKPGEYRLRLTKPGFQPWEKNFIVEEGIITEFKKIVLVPTVINTEPLKNEPADNFWLTEKTLIRQDTKKRLLVDNNQLKGSMIEMTRENSSLVITKDDAGIFFLTDLNNNVSVINLNHLFNSLRERQLKITTKTTIKKIWLHPFNPAKVIIQTAGAVYILDWQKLELETLIKDDDIKTAVIGRNEIFLINGKQELIIINLLLKNKIVKKFDADLNQITLNNFNNKIGLLTKNQFLLLNRSPEKLIATSSIETVKEFMFSPDNQYIAFLLENGKIKIWNLKENKISAVNWLGVKQVKSFYWPLHLPHYLLILSADNNLMLADIFQNPPFNIYLLMTEVKIYALKNKELYVLKNNGDLLKIDLNF